MMIIEEVGALIMWLAVFIGWLIKGCKTNLFNISYRAVFFR